ncbi:hypothetical protein CEN49_20570 [Fischerella thermalis CCMEE 5273]|nr:hypothetical protein CEN49_20570 [Fischerella thermalis CCMEE 5273]
METNELNNLRKKQIIYSNVIMMIIVTTCIYFVGTTSIGNFFSIIGWAVLSVGVAMLIKGEDILCAIPDMKKLWEYEKRKLGRGWIYNKKKNSIIYSMLIVVGIFMVLGSSSLYGFYYGEDPVVYLLFSLAIPILNIVSFLNLRRIDRSDSAEIQKALLFWSILILLVIFILFYISLH